MILRVDTETRERSKLWTGEIPHSSGQTHRQRNNIRHVLFVGNLCGVQTVGQRSAPTKESEDMNNFAHKVPPPIIYMSNVGPSHNPCYGINA